MYLLHVFTRYPIVRQVAQRFAADASGIALT